MEQIVGMTAEPRPTPTQIDRLIGQYAEAKSKAAAMVTIAAAATDVANQIKVEVTAMVEKWGGRHTEKSKRLEGLHNIATTTTGTLVSIIDEKVTLFRVFLGTTETPRLAEEFFTAHTSYSLIASPQEKLKGLHCGVRLHAKIEAMLKACFDIKTKTPSLKVELAEMKPAA